MPVRDEDPAAAPMPPEERTPDTPLELVRGILRSLLEDLSRLRPIREFLQTRGLTSVDQLDVLGRAELVAHLEEIRRSLYRTGRIL